MKKIYSLFMIYLISLLCVCIASANNETIKPDEVTVDNIEEFLKNGLPTGADKQAFLNKLDYAMISKIVEKYPELAKDPEILSKMNAENLKQFTPDVLNSFTEAEAKAYFKDKGTDTLTPSKEEWILLNKINPAIDGASLGETSGVQIDFPDGVSESGFSAITLTVPGKGSISLSADSPYTITTLGDSDIFIEDKNSDHMFRFLGGKVTEDTSDGTLVVTGADNNGGLGFVRFSPSHVLPAAVVKSGKVSIGENDELKVMPAGSDAVVEMPDGTQFTQKASETQWLSVFTGEYEGDAAAAEKCSNCVLYDSSATEQAGLLYINGNVDTKLASSFKGAVASGKNAGSEGYPATILDPEGNTLGSFVQGNYFGGDTVSDSVIFQDANGNVFRPQEGPDGTTYQQCETDCNSMGATGDAIVDITGNGIVQIAGACLIILGVIAAAATGGFGLMDEYQELPIPKGTPQELRDYMEANNLYHTRTPQSVGGHSSVAACYQAGGLMLAKKGDRTSSADCYVVKDGTVQYKPLGN
jgi:hypothetical protein